VEDSESVLCPRRLPQHRDENGEYCKDRPALNAHHTPRCRAATPRPLCAVEAATESVARPGPARHSRQGHCPQRCEASFSAIPSTVRCVFARGMDGVTDASPT